MMDKPEYHKACVIGWPITHSRSPLIHGYWLEHYNIAGSYTIQAVRPENLETFLKEDLKKLGYVGCNVTVPHKESAYSLTEQLDEMAEAVQAVNTLWFEGDILCGSNTDIYGFMTHLNESAPDWNKLGLPIAVLGAGGAARAVVFGLLQAGVNEIRLLNRTRSRAEELANFLNIQSASGHTQSCDLQVYDWEERDSAIKGCGLLVNTTSLGMAGGVRLGIDLNRLHDSCVVADIVYVPLVTDLLKQAKSMGYKTVDGLGMLLHQAVPGFEIWFSKKPQVSKKLYQKIIDDLEKNHH